MSNRFFLTQPAPASSCRAPVLFLEHASPSRAPGPLHVSPSSPTLPSDTCVNHFTWDLLKSHLLREFLPTF